MGSMGGGADLLPWWMRLAWVVVLCWVLASHFLHVLEMRGQPRYWHMTHMLMAIGMIYMFVAWQGLPISLRAAEMVFEAAALLVLGFVLLTWSTGRPVNLLWFLQLAGVGVMAYMFALMDELADNDVEVFTLVLAGLYVLEAAAWSRRIFAEADDRRLSWIPFSIGPSRRGEGVCAECLCGPVPVDLACSGTAMALSMSYMFIAMDSGARAFLEDALHGSGSRSAVVLVVGIAVVTLLVPQNWNRGGPRGSTGSVRAGADRTR